MADASLTSQNETVTLKLPSGEMVDAIVPGGLSDDQIKTLMQSKRPDLFGAPAGGIAGAPRPQVNMQQSPLGRLQGGPTGNAPDSMLPSPKAQMAEQTKPDPAVGAATIGALLGVAGGAAGGTGVGAALLPVARKYGIRALEGMSAGAGWEMYQALKKHFEGKE